MNFPALLFVVFVLASLPAEAGERGPVSVSPRDKCPVCGMFVSKYRDWNAQILFKDGSFAVFDGPKDLFICYLDLRRFFPSKRAGDISAFFVTGYYDVTPLDAKRAWYVIGSDVNGPMGKELIPFKSESDAREFLKDHKGTKILRFQDITREVIAGLD